tara:strand:- start:70120 stop:71250 length:1131 start_codon:yes stop_codon:yes gene_type:complete
LKKKLHILFLCGWYPSDVLPNNGDFIQRHAEAVALDQDVSVLHIVSSENCVEKIKLTSETINNVNTHIAYIKTSKNIALKIIRFWKAYKLLLVEIPEFDFVHLNKLYPFGLFALHLKFKKKKRYIISEHWSGYKTPMIYKLSLMHKIIGQLITRRAEFIVPISKDLGESMQKHGFKGNYDHVPNVVDTSAFVPIDKKEDIFTLVHISNMVDAYKNVSGIIRVIKKLESKIDHFKVKLIGAKPTGLINLVNQEFINPNKIEFIEYLPQEEMMIHLQKAHALLMFSNQENLPCVILEAFSCGTPVISTNVGGISEYFPQEFGFFVEKNDEIALLNKILDLYKNPILLKSKMHQYAVDNFSKQAISDSFSAIYYKSLNL